MSWLKRNTKSIPVVPDDAEERQLAIERSRAKYHEALSQVRPIMALAATTGRIVEDNHYQSRINAAYGVIPND